MAVAPNKCEVIKFSQTKRAPHANTNFTINGVIVPKTTRIRDLGVIFQSDLTFSHNIDSIIRKAHQRVNIFFNVHRHADLEVFLKCYTIYIRPLLEYGSVVFSPVSKEHIKALESVQKSFLFRCFKKSPIISAVP